MLLLEGIIRSSAPYQTTGSALARIGYRERNINFDVANYRLASGKDSCRRAAAL
jgi:hypothetical protein